MTFEEIIEVIETETLENPDKIENYITEYETFMEFKRFGFPINRYKIEEVRIDHTNKQISFVKDKKERILKD